MKGCIAAILVLCAVLAAVAVNAIYVHRVTDRLLAQLEALPEVPDTEATPEAIGDITAYLERNLTCLSLSVSYTLPDRIGESLAQLASYAKTGDTLQYAATLSLLRDLCRDIARAERFHMENIF